MKVVINCIMLNVFDQSWRQFPSSAGSVDAVAFVRIAVHGRLVLALRRDGTTATPFATRAISNATRATRVQCVGKRIVLQHIEKW